MDMDYIKIICPCCGEYRMQDHFDICPVCGWEHDPVQALDPNFPGGANRESLVSYRERFRKKREGDPQYRWDAGQ